mgnify:CR=1 FL=1
MRCIGANVCLQADNRLNLQCPDWAHNGMSTSRPKRPSAELTAIAPVSVQTVYLTMRIKQRGNVDCKRCLSPHCRLRKCLVEIGARRCINEVAQTRLMGFHHCAMEVVVNKELGVRDEACGVFQMTLFDHPIDMAIN